MSFLEYLKDKRFFNKNFSKPQRYIAFTLVEVLIVLSIIGLVAALIIPQIVQNYQKNQTVESLKTTYSVLNNALENAKIDNGSDVNKWYVPNDTEEHASEYFAKTYLLQSLKTIKICGSSTSTDCILRDVWLSPSLKSWHAISGNSNSYSFNLLNGAIVGVYVFNCNGTTVEKCRVQLLFDINGYKAPNIMGKDGFVIELGEGNSGTGNKNRFLPYLYNYSRDLLINSGDNTGCNKNNGNGARCFALIMKDGWNIADDYPW